MVCMSIGSILSLCLLFSFLMKFPFYKKRKKKKKKTTVNGKYVYLVSLLFLGFLPWRPY